MNLANTITIPLGNEVIHLVPRLRHAMRLEARPGSFAQIMREVAEESLTAACEIIGQHTDMTPEKQDRVLNALPYLKFPLISYIGQCTGIEAEDAPAEGKAKGQAVTVSFSEHLVSLYRLGTGWLGWTPKDTLESTPAEIKEAYKGRMEMLRAIFGSGEDKAKPDVPASPDQLTAKMKFLFSARAKKGA